MPLADRIKLSPEGTITIRIGALTVVAAEPRAAVFAGVVRHESGENITFSWVIPLDDPIFKELQLKSAWEILRRKRQVSDGVLRHLTTRLTENGARVNVHYAIAGKELVTWVSDTKKFVLP